MNNLTLFGIFLEGLLSFLSPCILPLIPLYISYLSSEEINEDGEIKRNKFKTILKTICFIAGILLTFVIFATSLNFLSIYLEQYRELILIIGGTILIIFSLHHLGLINISLLNQDFSFINKIKFNSFEYLKSFLLGFAFSFAWSPCIGPLLANAIMMAASQANGYLYILTYALGLILPFLLTGLFTTQVLSLIQKHKNISKYVLKITGVILLCYGIYMIYDGNKALNGYKELINNQSNENISDPLSYTYVDQNGNKVKLSDYKGKYVYLNLITTWCGYCRQEIPEYLKYANDNSEAICLYAMSPFASNEKDIDGIKDYIKEQGIDIPVIIDEKGILFLTYGVNAYPTLFIIDPDGELLAYSQGAIDYDGMFDLHRQAIDLYSQKGEK